jgi:hypothetical protein
MAGISAAGTSAASFLGANPKKILELGQSCADAEDLGLGSAPLCSLELFGSGGARNDTVASAVGTRVRKERWTPDDAST